MWSYNYSKSSQVWLWWTIDHVSIVPVAFWFGSRESGNFKIPQKLLAPLNIVMNYVDGNWAYVDNVSAERLMVSRGLRKRLSVSIFLLVGVLGWCEGDSFFKVC
jgi:IS1 family transposase